MPYLSTTFSYGLQHIHIRNIFVSEVLLNCIYGYTLGPLFSFLDERSSVATKLQQGYDLL